MNQLYRIRFEGTVPDVGVEGGVVTVEYPRFGWRKTWRKIGADIALNGSIPWRISIGGGLSELDADLGGIRLDSFEVEGASRAELTLAEPFGTVPVSIDGGAVNVTIRRPEGVAASILVGGGAGKLALVAQRLGAVAGKTRLESPSYASATHRYEITISRGASDVAVISQ